MGAILGHILTFPDPHCRPGQIFVVKDGVYMCPAYSTTCFEFNQHLRGVFQALRVYFGEKCHFWLFLRTFPHSQFGHFRCPKQKSKTTFQTQYRNRAFSQKALLSRFEALPLWNRLSIFDGLAKTEFLETFFSIRRVFRTHATYTLASKFPFF